MAFEAQKIHLVSDDTAKPEATGQAQEVQDLNAASVALIQKAASEGGEEIDSELVWLAKQFSARVQDLAENAYGKELIQGDFRGEATELRQRGETARKTAQAITEESDLKRHWNEFFEKLFSELLKKVMHENLNEVAVRALLKEALKAFQGCDEVKHPYTPFQEAFKRAARTHYPWPRATEFQDLVDQCPEDWESMVQTVGRAARPLLPPEL